MKNITKIMALIVMFVALATTAHGKTVVKERVNNYTLKVQQSRGVTTVKWNNRVYHRYDFGGKVKILPERKMTYKLRTHRKNKYLLIERCVGRVVDNKGNGITTNGNYISYKYMRKHVRKGDKVITYLVYTPYTNWFDDVDDRFDIIL